MRFWPLQFQQACSFSFSHKATVMPQWGFHVLHKTTIFDWSHFHHPQLDHSLINVAFFLERLLIKKLPNLGLTTSLAPSWPYSSICRGISAHGETLQVLQFNDGCNCKDSLKQLCCVDSFVNILTNCMILFVLFWWDTWKEAENVLQHKNLLVQHLMVIFLILILRNRWKQFSITSWYWVHTLLR